MALAVLDAPSRHWPANRRACCAASAGQCVNLRVDSDVPGGQDQGYSNRMQLTLVSPNLRDYMNDPCRPRLARWVNRCLVRFRRSRSREEHDRDLRRWHLHADFNRSNLVEDGQPENPFISSRGLLLSPCRR
jgi:hypothetical protein